MKKHFVFGSIYLFNSIVQILIWQEWINILLSLRKIRAYQKLFLSSFTIQSHSKKTFRKLVLSLLNINNRPLKVQKLSLSYTLNYAVKGFSLVKRTNNSFDEYDMRHRCSFYQPLNSNISFLFQIGDTDDTIQHWIGM